MVQAILSLLDLRPSVRYDVASMSGTPRKESFEDHLKIVEETVRALESEQLPLEEAMAKYEAGMLAHAKCKEILAGLEKKIEQLVRRPDGSLGTRPLDAAPEKSAPGPKEREPRVEGPRKKRPDEDLPF